MNKKRIIQGVTRFSAIICSLLCYNNALAAGTVTICDEPHLRAALVGGGTVTFAADGTILLTSTLVLTNDTVIDASGHSVAISGSSTVRICNINPNVTASFINLTLANGRQTGAAGAPDGQPGMGGAILNTGGTAQLTGCTVISNSVVGGDGVAGVGGQALGGAIYSIGGSIMITNCSFISNTGTGGAGGDGPSNGFPGGDTKGGAIGSTGGTVVIWTSTLLNNIAKGGPAGADVGFTSRPGQAGSAFGGAVWSENATGGLFQVVFIGNQAVGRDLASSSSGSGGAGSGKGGAVGISNGVVNCVDCTFATNTARAGFKPRYGNVGIGQGGAIWSHAALSISQCSFSGNQAVGNGRGGGFGGGGETRGGEGSGGAIWTESSLVLVTSLFSGNQAHGGMGGDIQFNNWPGGTGRGGAVCNLGTLTATNCTLDGNLAQGGPAGDNMFGPPGSGGVAAGGGVYNSNGIITLVNLTLNLNSAVGGPGSPLGGNPGVVLGGTIHNTNGTVNLYNTIVAISAPGTNCFGVLTDLGHNLASDGSCNFASLGSLNSTDPVLGPLGDFGGPTPTLPLLAGSPAIDGGDNASFPPTDQRGHARPFGSAPDIGAFESSPPYTIRGIVSGNTLKDEVSVTAGSTTVATTNQGNYSLDGLAANIYSVTPPSVDYLFLPGNRSVTVGPDQLGVNFKAYHWNALSLDDVTNGTMHIIFAATNGSSYRLLTSTNLVQWLPVSTNSVGAGNYSELFIPVGTERAQFYRTLSP